MKQMKMAIPMVKFGNGNNKSWLPNTVNPIRIHPIMMQIIFHRYKMLKERTSSFVGFDNSPKDNEDNDINDSNNIDSIILRLEIDKWYNFPFCLEEKESYTILRNVTIIIQIFIFNRYKRKRKFYRIVIYDIDI